LFDGAHKKGGVGLPAETKAFCELRRTKRFRVAGQPSMFLRLQFL